MMVAIVIVGLLIQLFGVSRYVIDTWHGRTKPNRVSWSLLGLQTGIGVVAALKSGAGWAIIPTVVSAINCFIIVFVSFRNKKSYWKIGKIDYVCGSLSILAIILWRITDDPIIAIIFSLLADNFACIPLYIKAWRRPETETATNFVCGTLSQVPALIVMPAWTFGAAAWPVYLFLSNGIIAIEVLRKHRRKRRRR